GDEDIDRTADHERNRDAGDGAAAQEDRQHDGDRNEQRDGDEPDDADGYVALLQWKLLAEGALARSRERVADAGEHWSEQLAKGVERGDADGPCPDEAHLGRPYLLAHLGNVAGDRMQRAEDRRREQPGDHIAKAHRDADGKPAQMSRTDKCEGEAVGDAA